MAKHEKIKNLLHKKFDNAKMHAVLTFHIIQSESEGGVPKKSIFSILHNLGFCEKCYIKL